MKWRSGISSHVLPFRSSNWEPPAVATWYKSDDARPSCSTKAMSSQLTNCLQWMPRLRFCSMSHAAGAAPLKQVVRSFHSWSRMRLFRLVGQIEMSRIGPESLKSGAAQGTLLHVEHAWPAARSSLATSATTCFHTCMSGTTRRHLTPPDAMAFPISAHRPALSCVEPAAYSRFELRSDADY